MQRRKRHEPADEIDLEGPSGSTLTLPPLRRTGVVVTIGIVGAVLLGAGALALAQPAFFVRAVQAFVGGV